MDFCTALKLGSWDLNLRPEADYVFALFCPSARQHTTDMKADYLAESQGETGEIS